MKTTHLIPPVSNRCLPDPLRTPQQEIRPATNLPEINTGPYFHPSLSGCRPVPHRYLSDLTYDTLYRFCVNSPTGAVFNKNNF